jgi:cystathionine beta-lyase family protein involved in aluminum resistance
MQLPLRSALKAQSASPKNQHLDALHHHFLEQELNMKGYEDEVIKAAKTALDALVQVQVADKLTEHAWDDAE